MHAHLRTIYYNVVKNNSISELLQRRQVTKPERSENTHVAALEESETEDVAVPQAKKVSILITILI